MKIKVVNGPNLNLLGIRKPEVYGTITYQELTNQIQSFCAERGITVEIVQSNHEGSIVDAIHDAYFKGFNGLIINPGAYTHYSYAIRDALEAIEGVLKVEVHLSNIYARESFRAINVIRDVVDWSIVGKGIEGYFEAITLIASKKCRQRDTSSL